MKTRKLRKYCSHKRLVMDKIEKEKLGDLIIEAYISKYEEEAEKHVLEEICSDCPCQRSQCSEGPCDLARKAIPIYELILAGENCLLN